MRNCVLLVLAFIITSCGGGGGAGPAEPTSPPPTPPVTSGTGGSSNADNDTPVTAVDPQTLNFATYFSGAFKLLLKAPESWRWDYEVDSDITEAYFIGTSLDPSEPLPPLIYIGRITDSGGDVTDDGDSDSSDFSFVSSTYVYVDGLAALQTVLDSVFRSSSGNEIEIRTVVTGFEFNDSSYGVVYAAPKEYFPKYELIYQYVLDQVDLGLVVFDDLTNNGMVSRPAIASDGQDFFAVTCRYQGGAVELVGRIIDSSGEVSSDILIEGPYSGLCDQSPVDVTFDGLNYLVVYVSEDLDVQLKRVNREGFLIDEAPINISGDTSMPEEQDFYPSIASDGNRSLIVWYQEANHPTVYRDEIRGRFIGTSGVLSDPITLDDSPQGLWPAPRITYGNNHYFVAWNPHYDFESQGYTDVDMTIYGQIVDLGGNLVLPESITIRSDVGYTPRYTEVASDGNGFLVSWIEGLEERDDRSRGDYSIYAKRLNTLGQLLDGDAADPGIEIVPPHNWDLFRQTTKDYLDVNYDQGQYFFNWSTLNNSEYSSKGSLNDATGVYGLWASTDLSTLGEPQPIAGNNGQSYASDLEELVGSRSVSTDNLSIAIWVSKDGILEAWTTAHVQKP